MVTTTSVINVALDIPPDIAQGLADGTLERVGGVIREAGSKHVRVWLREVSDAKTVDPSLLINQLNRLMPMAQLSATASVLTLGVAVAGFALISYQLNSIETRLKAMQEQLNKIDQKIDLGFYASFRAGLDMAKIAFRMDSPHNRKAMVCQAIEKFAESEHVYAAYLNQALQNQDRAINEYLSMLALLYLTETLCYLELGEHETAIEKLQEGSDRLQTFTRVYIEMLLTSNPAAYLTPYIREEISLTRLTRIYQWLEPGIDESDVFEKLRQYLFDWHVDASILGGFRWLENLPPAILSEEEFDKKGPFNKSAQIEQALTCLPKTLAIMEAAIETHNRLEGYQTEISAMQELGMTFQDWQSLRPNEAPSEGAQMMCIMAA